MAGSCKNAMSYGMLTDYSENCSLNEFVRDKYKVGPDATNMRLFLQRNGDAVRSDMLKKAEYVSVTGCQCYSGFPPHSEEWEVYPYEDSQDSLRQYHRGDPIPNAHAQNEWRIPAPKPRRTRKAGCSSCGKSKK